VTDQGKAQKLLTQAHRKVVLVLGSPPEAAAKQKIHMFKVLIQSVYATQNMVSQCSRYHISQKSLV